MRGMSFAAFLCLGASAAASARPAGLPVEIVETFNRFTPGVALNQQAATAGCPGWDGDGLVTLRSGSTSNIAIQSKLGASRVARGILPVRLYPAVGVDATASMEAYSSSLASTAVMRAFVIETNPPIGQEAAYATWGGVLENVTCNGQTGVSGPLSSFAILELCPGQTTNGWWVDSGAPTPVGSWFQLEFHKSVDGRHTWLLDLMDGSPAIELSQWPGLMVDIGIDRVIVDHWPTSASELMYVDNMVFRGMSPRPACPGDATRNGTVNFADLNVVLSEFGQVGGANALAGDVNGDGAVNFADLNATLSAFGTQCGCIP